MEDSAARMEEELLKLKSLQTDSEAVLRTIDTFAVYNGVAMTDDAVDFRMHGEELNESEFSRPGRVVSCDKVLICQLELRVVRKDIMHARMMAEQILTGFNSVQELLEYD